MATTSLMAKANDDSDTIRLVEQAATGNDQAWAELIARHRDRLKQMIALRMDHRLRGRVDPSDVIQEACLVASKQISKYAANPGLPFYLWLRWIAGQRLIDQQRRHLGAKIRGVSREVSFFHGTFPEATRPRQDDPQPRLYSGVLQLRGRIQSSAGRQLQRRLPPVLYAHA